MAHVRIHTKQKKVEKMKETISKKMKEAGILLIASVIVLSTVAVTADTNDQSPTLIMLAGKDYISHSQQTNTFDSDWIHFDDGTNVNAIGLTAGGTMEWAARFTSDELVDLAGYQISVVRYHHSWATGPPFEMSGNIKIYEEGTSIKPGSLITSEPFEAYNNDWFDVELSEPVLIAGDEDIWVSVEGPHKPGQHPAGCDDGPMISGKGGWIYFSGGWEEISTHGFNVNWNIWAEVEFPTEPPEKPQRPDGPIEGVIGIEYTFSTSTTDPEGEQVCYLWDWDDETPTEWTDLYDSGVTVNASHIWTETGKYNITVKAKDIHGEESEWSDPKTIHIIDTAIIEIGNITGRLFKVSMVIKNTGGVDATSIDWDITLDGGLILLGKETSGSILSLPAGGEKTVSSSLILGFGKTLITATAECAESSNTSERDAFVFLFIIL